MSKPYPIRICIGPTCDGAERVAEMKQHIAERQYPVEVTGMGCIGQCDYGPNVVVGKTLLSESATTDSIGRKPQRPLEESLDRLFGKKEK